MRTIDIYMTREKLKKRTYLSSEIDGKDNRID